MFNLIFALVAFGASSTFAGELEDLTQRELASPHLVTTRELKSIQATQFIFVDGIFGDFYHGNFKPAEQVLREDYQTEGTTLVPQSVVPIQDNSEIIFSRVRDLREASGKSQAILMGHSKGAGELMYMLLRHPEVVRNMGISAIGIISAPLAGTRVVGFIDTMCANEGPHSLCHFLNVLFPSLESFRPEFIQPLYSEALERLSSLDRALIGSKIFYVRTQMPKDDFNSPLYLPNLWMRTSHPEDGPNDGAIPTKNQIMYENGFNPNDPVFGTDLGIMMIDHNGLMNRARTPASLRYRESFFKILTRKLLFAQDHLLD